MKGPDSASPRTRPPAPHVPPEIRAALARRGIDEQCVRSAEKIDMSRDYVRCVTWLLLTENELISVSGVNAVDRAENGRPFGPKINRHFEEFDFTVFLLEEYEDFSVEEQISSVRLSALCKADGTYRLLAAATNSGKRALVALADKLRRHGEGDQDHGRHAPPDEHPMHHHGGPGGGPGGGPMETECPKCGRKYADPERKLCLHCISGTKLMRRVWDLIAKYKLLIGVVLGMLLLSSAMAVISPYLSSGFFYDEVLNAEGTFYGQILFVLVLIIGTKLLNLLVTVVHNITSSVVAAKLVYDLKKIIFSSIERLSIGFFTGRQTGGLMTQVTRDANTIYWFFCDWVPYFLMNVVQIVAILVIMAILNPILTLVSVVALPAIFLLFKAAFSKMRIMHNRRFSATRSMRSLLTDLLSGIRVVKIFSREESESTRFTRRSEALADAERRASLYNQKVMPALTLLLYVTNTLVIWAVGGWMVIEDTMTYGELLTFIAYAGMISAPIHFFIDIFYSGADCLSAMSRLVEVMDAIPDVTESENPIRPETIRGEVSFKNVDFSYEKSRRIIKNISFDIKPGEMVGIVGRTGAGKSTLANLLIRLYDPDHGTIELDGMNVRDIAFASLRRSVAIVSQETYLFSGTILDNIRYARPDATYEEVVEAAKASGAHDFIIKLPDAYATRIGTGNQDLSGGERQRVSIARAILLDPRILILDEATAAMDTETERKIQDAIERLTEGRTTIMIAHRLSTLRNADSLIVIENGTIAEVGSHDELIRREDGIYRKLYQLQAEALRSVGIET